VIGISTAWLGSVPRTCLDRFDQKGTTPGSEDHIGATLGTRTSAGVPLTSARDEASTSNLEKLNLFLALVGLVSVVAALVANLWSVAFVIAVSYLALQIVVAVYERNIPWPAWRIIITLVIIGRSSSYHRCRRARGMCR